MLAENDAVRVVSFGGGLIIACRRGDLSHGIRLADNRRGENEKGGDMSSTIVNGRFVAVVSATYDPSGSVVDCWIDEWDIGSGVRTLYKLHPGEPVPDKPSVDCYEVVVVMAPDGRLAWQARPEASGALQPGELRIHAWTPSGVSILDPGRVWSPDR